MKRSPPHAPGILVVDVGGSSVKCLEAGYALRKAATQVKAAGKSARKKSRRN